MNRCLISLGANLGNPRETMRSAARAIIEITEARAIKASQLYRTPPIGGPEGQGDFLNAVMAFETPLDVHELAAALHAVEAKLGRHRQMRWEARPIDLDILLFSNQRVLTEQLKIPHPRMSFRSFVIRPAAEIVPDWIDPVSQQSIQQLADILNLERSCVLLTSNSKDWLASLTHKLGAYDPAKGERFQNVKYSERVWIVPAPAREFPATLQAGPIALDSILQIDAILPGPISGLLVSPGNDEAGALPSVAAAVHWADLLNLTDNGLHALEFDGPRYLIPPCDIEWALHEIHASIDAMTCFVEPTGEQLV